MADKNFTVELELLKAHIQKDIEELRNEAKKLNDSFKETGKETDDTNKKMSNLAKVGIAGLIGAVAGAIKQFYDLNQQYKENTRLSQQLLGESGKITAQITATSKTFNKEFSEVAISVNALAEGLNISNQEALKLINEGFLAGADASGEFLDQIKEYPTQMHAVGISAEQMISIIQQSVDKGIFSDKGLDSIKEAGIRIREMTPATKDAINGIGLSSEAIQKSLEDGSKTIFEVIQDVSTQLDKLPPQSTEVGTAIADIFGGPGEDAGLEFLTTLKDIDGSMSQINSTSSKLTEQQRRQLETNEQLESIYNKIFNVLGSGFDTLINDVKFMIVNAIPGMLKGMQDFVNYWIDLYNESAEFRVLVEALKLTFKTFIEAGKLGLEVLINSFKSLGDIIKALFTPGGSVGEAFQQFRDNLTTSWGNFTKSFENNYASAFKNAIDKAKTAHVDFTGFLKEQEEVRKENAVKSNDSAAAGKIKIDKKAALESIRNSDKEKKAFEKMNKSKIQSTVEYALTSKASAEDVAKHVVASEIKEAISGLVSSILKSVPFPFNLALAATAGILTKNVMGEALGGFQTGGFTGFGSDTEAAGVVHRNELVIDANTIRNIQAGAPVSTALRSGGGFDNEMIEELADAISSRPIAIRHTSTDTVDIYDRGVINQELELAT